MTSMQGSPQSLLRTISTVWVTPEDLTGGAEDILAQLSELPSVAIIVQVAQRCGGDMYKAGAIFFRLQALAYVLRTTPQPFSGDTDEGLAHALFAAAAVHPLVTIGGRVAFERNSFFARARELCMDGFGQPPPMLN